MCISTDPIFYVYVYLDPRKPGYYVYGNYIFEYEPIYVGKGSNGRLHHHLQEYYQTKNKSSNKHLTSKINKIRKETGIDPFIIKVNEGLTEDISFELERELICVIGRHDEKLGPLCNHTDGGDGSSGHIKSEEAKRKISKGNKGKIVSEEARKKMSKSRKEFCQTKEGKECIMNSHILQKGRHLSEDHKQKLRDAKAKARLEREANKPPVIPPSPKWLITYPDGSTIQVVSLSKFCKDNGLTKQSLHWHWMKKTGKTYKGYKCEKINLDK